MRFCNKSLNPFQRRSIQLIGSLMGSCVALGVVFQSIKPNHFSAATCAVIAAIAVTPIIGTMIVIARYLAGEKDEYLRNMVVRAILWGFGMVMVIDTFLGYLVQYQPVHLPFLLLNMDIFVVTAMITLRVQMWRNQ
jgi:hypothetical protein